MQARLESAADSRYNGYMSEQLPKLDLIKKQITKKEDYGGGVIDERVEARWFVETNDGFDGTAQGYGYKTPQALYKAYHYFLNKNKYAKQKQEVKQWLKDNADVQSAFKEYFHEDNCLYRMKDREPTSIENLISSIKDDQPDVVQKLNGNKNLWKPLMKYYCD
jgi:hypothetical protein